MATVTLFALAPPLNRLPFALSICACDASSRRKAAAWAQSARRRVRVHGETGAAEAAVKDHVPHQAASHLNVPNRRC